MEERVIKKILDFVAVHVDDLDWIYDTDPHTGHTFKLKEVFTDEGLEIIYSIYPKGYVKPDHHHTFGQGIYCLDGDMVADGKIYKTGDFVWWPEGKVGSHGATDYSDSTFIAINTGVGMPIYDEE